MADDDVDMSADVPEVKLDEELYNRQLYVMGHDAQRKLGSSAVLLVGLGGVGVEIAKNIILMGVKAVALYDPAPVTLQDLSSQFYCGEGDVGKPRAAACRNQLAELNNYVHVTVHTGGLDAADLRAFRAVVACDATLPQQLALNAACRSVGAAFLSAFAWGVLGGIFCDLGDEFTVEDHTGEPPRVCMVRHISQEEHGAVTVTEENRHGLSDGAMVAFTEVEGMAINNVEPRKIKVTGPFGFTIGDTRGLGEYVSGGWMREVKQPKKFAFKPLAEALLKPEFVHTDWAKDPRQLHTLFRALHAFQAKAGHLPATASEADADQVVALYGAMQAAGDKDAGSEVSEKTADLVKKVARTCRGNLAPMAAAIGGIAAQEVIKACSGKFTPIRQWMYIDAREALPDKPLPPAEYAPRGDRYDGQVAVFGRSMQAKIQKLRYFLVGAGAIGCEILKNWAMMGVGCSAEGLVTVTDMDNIEKSNLSRQFLFRPRDVKAAKSVTAVKAVSVMNPDFHGKAMELRVGRETEDVYHDDFWDDLSGVCTALDNVDARLYVDSRCLFYRKPMLESGTLGTKGNTQIVVPRITEHYGASRDPPEASIPVCTLKHFPNKIEHTLQWATDWFEGELNQAPDLVNQYLTDKEFVAKLDANMNSKLSSLRRIKAALVTDRPVDMGACVAWARRQFQKLFHDDILQLLHNFPPDSVTSSGGKFWSGTKRAPNPVIFSATDPTHMDFIRTAAAMYGECYGLKPPADDEFYRKAVLGVTVTPFKPKSIRIAATDEEAKKMQEAGAGSGAAAAADDDDEGFTTAEKAAQLVAALPTPVSLAGFRLRPVEFEKDDDFHMTLITAVSNLRARNYRIDEADKHQSKLIAGKIIPAIATTTAMVAGLICMELYKLMQSKPLESYRSCFANLALAMFSFSEPMRPTTSSIDLPSESGSDDSGSDSDSDSSGKQWEFSDWDSLDFQGPLTLQQLIDNIQDKFGVEVSMLSHGNSLVDSFFGRAETKARRRPMTLERVVEDCTGEPLPPNKRYLVFEVCCTDEDDEDVDLPSIRYRIPHSGGGAGAGAGSTAAQ